MGKPRESRENPVPVVGTMPGRNGGRLKRGGTNPGAGRPPNEFKDFLKREIRDNPESRAALIRAASDEESRSFGSAWKLAAEYDEAKPSQKHEVGGLGGGPVIVKIVREGRRRTA